MPTGFYGVNSGSGLVSNPAARPAAFSTMRAGGLSFVRVDASWGGVEPAPPVAGVHTYNWATYDSFVADLARNGLRWYPVIGYSTPWASSAAGDPFAPPSSDADYAAFAAAVAKRYGSSGSFWAEHPELPRLPTTVYGTLNKYGLSNVPIEVSEVGWHTGFTTAQRAQWLRGLAAKLPHAGLNATRLMPYVWADSPEWSINNPDGSLGQIGVAYFAGIRDASAATKVRPGLKVERRSGGVRFSGAIVPAVPGARASLQRKRKGSAGFVTVRRSTVRRLGNKRSRYRMTVGARRRTSVYRVVVRPPASSGHARGTSRERRVRVTRGR